jgi:hypothetical protein
MRQALGALLESLLEEIAEVAKASISRVSLVLLGVQIIHYPML